MEEKVETDTVESKIRDRVRASNFIHDVATTPRGRGVLACIQCGRCTGSCPIARLTEEHNPRRLIEEVILGLKWDVLFKLPWYCVSCFTCLDRCPAGGDVAEVMFAVRNLAVREGSIPKGMVDQAKTLLSTGLIIPPSESMIEEREKQGLPKVTFAAEDAQKILKKTGFSKIIEGR